MADPTPADRLPFHCQPVELFAAAVVAELVVLVVQLHGLQARAWDWVWFSQVSLFAQWLVLLSGLLICWLRPWLLRLPGSLPAILAFQIAPLITAVSTMGLYFLDELLQLGLQQRLPDAQRMLLVNTGTVLLVSAAFFRYLHLRADWQARVQAEARARLEALQARIRPHFLFNSINTVVSLIGVDAQKAEQTLMDLAALFRGVLSVKQACHTLDEEWALVEHYLRIEKLRLGERLQLKTGIETEARPCRLPALLLQPLVENAIYHGVEPNTEGGRVDIEARIREGRLELVVENPLLDLNSDTGLGMAQENVRQRLRLFFQDQARMLVKEVDGRYRVELLLPQVKNHEPDTDC